MQVTTKWNRIIFEYTYTFIFMFSRHFIDQETLDAHKGTKLHKKRLKCLAEGAYTIEEANAAGGSGSSEFYKKRVEKVQSLQQAMQKKNFKKIDANKSNESEPVSLMAYE